MGLSNTGRVRAWGGGDRDAKRELSNIWNKADPVLIWRAMMLRQSIQVTRSFVLACGLCAAGAAFGQTYPNRPVRVLTIDVGGAVDITLRLIAQAISGPLGQQIIIENKPSSLHPEDTVARSTPNGYTLLYCANGLWLAPFLRVGTPYDPQKDFAPVSLTVKGPNVLAANSALSASSVAELIAFASAKPGELNVAVTGAGGSPHLAAVLFQAMTGAKFTNIAYKGATQAINDLRGGRVDLFFPTMVTSLPLAKAGKLKVLAVTSAERSALAPDLPTVAESGVQGYESVAIHGLFAPAKTTDSIITRLNQEVVKFLVQSESREKIKNMGLDIIASTPEQLSATIKMEMEKMARAIKVAGIHPE